jgi:hypothetical protein
VAYHYYFHLIITAQSVKGCLSRQGVYTNINGAAIAKGVVGEAGRSRKVKRPVSAAGEPQRPQNGNPAYRRSSLPKQNYTV